jgi:hypothetical protein
MCDTSFNALQISMKEIRMKQLDNNSKINYISAEVRSIQTTMLNSQIWYQNQSLEYQKKFDNLDEQIQLLKNQVFPTQLPKRL